MDNNSDEKAILGFLNSLPVYSDHEHHADDGFFAQKMSMELVYGMGYTGWNVPPIDDSVARRNWILENFRYNSYFAWLERGVQKVHGIDEPLTADNWDSVSDIIAAHYAKDPEFHWHALRENGYERLLQDCFWDPGSDLGHPEMFTPVFRIDKFMYGFHNESVAPDNIIPWKKYGFHGRTLDEFVECMRTTITVRHAAGKVAALKCAEAYNRSISFQPDDKVAAEKAFGVHPSKITAEQKNLFGNYIFNRACELAAELDVPFQVHTGLAMLSGSNPMNLEPTIARHKGTRFVLFHSGYPWTGEVAGLAHVYANALPNMTWTPIICTASAVRALDDYIDVARSIRTITWGSDCWVPEESVGAMQAWRYVVARVLARRLCDGRLNAAGVEDLGRKLMFENARYLYGAGV